MRINKKAITKIKLALAEKVRALRNKTKAKRTSKRTAKKIPFISKVKQQVKLHRVIRLLTMAVFFVLVMALFIYSAAPGDIFYALKRKTEGVLRLPAATLVGNRLDEYQAVGGGNSCVQTLLSRDQVLVGLQRAVDEQAPLSDIYHILSDSEFPISRCVTALPTTELRVAVALIAGSRSEQTGEMYEREVAARKVRIRTKYNSIADQDVNIDLLIFTNNLFNKLPTNFDDALSQVLLRELAVASLVTPEVTNIPESMYKIAQTICVLKPQLSQCDDATLASEFAQMEAENDPVLQLSHSERLFNNFISSLTQNEAEN